jgi:hypothetical protein
MSGRIGARARLGDKPSRGFRQAVSRTVRKGKLAGACDPLS